MTVGDDNLFRTNLQLYRNRAKMLLFHHLNSVVDAIVLEEEPVLPVITRSGSLEYSKNQERFGKE